MPFWCSFCSYLYCDAGGLLGSHFANLENRSLLTWQTPLRRHAAYVNHSVCLQITKVARLIVYNGVEPDNLAGLSVLRNHK